MLAIVVTLLVLKLDTFRFTSAEHPWNMPSMLVMLPPAMSAGRLAAVRFEQPLNMFSMLASGASTDV